MKVFLGADHRGFNLKQRILQWLQSEDVGVEDLGAYDYEAGDDYTLYAQKVAVMVREDPRYRGVLFCGSGVGVDVVANKFDGIRASIGKEVDQVRAGRFDDNMNVLVIASDYTSEEEARDMIKIFLNTSFSGKKRHRRRLSDIKKIEENN